MTDAHRGPIRVLRGNAGFVVGIAVPFALMAGGPTDFNLSDHIHQAAGMVAAQSDCNIGEALARLTLRAEETGQTLEEVSLDVLDRIVRFDE